MSSFGIYNSNGEIILVKSGAEPLDIEIPSGGGFIDVAGHSRREVQQTHYVLNGALEPRPSFQILGPSSGVVSTDVVFTNIPEGATITHPGGEVVMDSSEELEWQTTVAGVYQFTFELFPYKTEVLTVEISA